MCVVVSKTVSHVHVTGRRTKLCSSTWTVTRHPVLLYGRAGTVSLKVLCRVGRLSGYTTP
jgi:hypothetical protein